MKKYYYLFVIIMIFFIAIIFSDLEIEPKTDAAKAPEFVEVFTEDETDKMMYHLKSDIGVD